MYKQYRLCELQEKDSKNNNQSLSFFALCEQIHKIYAICGRILALSSPCRKMGRSLGMRLGKYHNKSVDTIAIIWILEIVMQGISQLVK